MKTLRHLIFLPVLILSLPAMAQQWQTRGPNGGFAYGYYRDAGRLWLASSGGVFFSTDNGISWNNPAMRPADFSCDNVRSVAANGLELYAGTETQGVYHSGDGGANWTTSNNTLLRGIPYTDVEITGTFGFAIRSDSGFVYRSPDRGNSWLRVMNIGSGRALLLSQHGGTDLYVTTSTGLYRSTDGGQSFSLLSSSAQDMGKPWWDGDTLYVATASGIKKSLDSGATYSSVALSGTTVNSVAISGASIYASIQAGSIDSLIVSSNSGAAFTGATYYPAHSSYFASNIFDISASGNTVQLGSIYGNFYSGNAGVSWQRADSGFHATRALSLAVSGTNLFVAAAPMGVFFSPDSAASWRFNGGAAQGIDGFFIRAVSVKNQFVHAGGQDYYRSTNFGNTWTSGATGLPAVGAGPAISSVWASPASRRVLLVRNGTLHVSDDDGLSFAATATGLPPGQSVYVTGIDTAVFVSAPGTGLFMAGSALAFQPANGITSPVVAVTFMDSLYYAGTATAGIYSSRDGINWSAISYPAPYTASSIRVTALLADSGRLFVGTGNGILRVQPVAGTAVPIITAEGLQGHSIYSLTAINNHLFAGTCNGVWSRMFDPILSVAPAAHVGNDALMVYPNPASGNFYLRIMAGKSGAGTLVIKNLLGTTVLRQSANLQAGSNVLMIDSRALPAGMYVLQVTAWDGTLGTARVILR